MAFMLVAWFLYRWQVDVTLQAVGTYLGGEVQRQWSAPAIVRTTPVLLGLFRWVTVVAHALLRGRLLTPRRVACYPKARPIFADALAPVRITFWTGIVLVDETWFLLAKCDPRCRDS